MTEEAFCGERKTKNSSYGMWIPSVKGFPDKKSPILGDHVKAGPDDTVVGVTLASDPLIESAGVEACDVVDDAAVLDVLESDCDGVHSGSAVASS